MKYACVILFMLAMVIPADASERHHMPRHHKPKHVAVMQYNG